MYLSRDGHGRPRGAEWTAPYPPITTHVALQHLCFGQCNWAEMWGGWWRRLMRDTCVCWSTHWQLRGIKEAHSSKASSALSNALKTFAQYCVVYTHTQAHSDTKRFYATHHTSKKPLLSHYQFIPWTWPVSEDCFCLLKDTVTNMNHSSITVPQSHLN